MSKRKIGAGLGLAAMVVVLWASMASAHVTIQPPTATQGGYPAFAFRVPSEKDVPTVKLRVKFPDDHPFAAARVKPVPGWTADIKTKTLTTPIKTDDGEMKEAVDTIEWTGGSIAPDEFQEFEVALGPMPTDTTSLTFPAIQTYADGSEVAWIDPPGSSDEAAHPAPTLTLTAAAATGTDDHGMGTTAPAASSDHETAAATASTTTTSSSNVIGWVGVGLGAVALVVALVAVARSGKASTD